MMEYLRFGLSMLIMVSHLATIRAWPNVALIGFYILSGYSISARGTGGDFWVGRILKLWPIYIVIAATTQLALWLGWPPGLPYIELAKGWDAFINALMVVPTWPDGPALVPVAWMLKWIILGYAVAWSGAFKTLKRTGLCLLISFLVSHYLLATPHLIYQDYYISFVCAFTAMAMGALLWQIGYVAPKENSPIAQTLGAMAYPIFLLHYTVGAAIATVLGVGLGWPLFFAALAPTLALSWVLVVAVERPVQKFRSSLEKNNAPTP